MAATPVGRLVFPNLFKPTTYKGKTKFTATILFDKDEDLSSIEKEINAVIKKKWPDEDDKPDDFHYPIQDGDKKGKKYPEYKGKKFITLKANEDHPPAVVGRKKENLESKDIYSGCFVRASYNVFAYDDGVAFGLSGIQKTDDGPRISGSANPDADFDVIDSIDDDPAF